MKLKTGGDPRSLPDYAALPDEISKLTHPARPDVDWRYVETLCLRLYEHNGVELQNEHPGTPSPGCIQQGKWPE
ncbi:type VI secretion system ImpA family N-terminal domain-containing protein [Escherichia coli]